MASIYSQATTEASARLISAQGDPYKAGLVLTRSWPWLATYAASGSTIDDLIAALNAIETYTNPQANEQTYSGTFIHKTVKGDDENTRGDAERDGNIIQTLIRIKFVTDVDSLGNADESYSKEVLNFLGIVEGTENLAIYTYRNLDPTALDDAADLLPTPPADYTRTKYDSRVESDGTGTAFFIFSKILWPTDQSEGSTPVWANDKVLMSESNTGGFAEQELRELTGLDKADYGAVFTASLSPDTARVIKSARQVERGKGEYAVEQLQGKTIPGALDEHAIIIEYQDDVNGSQNKMLKRVWWRRNLADKDLLVAFDGTSTYGPARTDYTFEAIDYAYSGVRVTDHGDGAYSVVQTLVDNTVAGSVTFYFNENWPEEKVQTRATDNAIKITNYTHHVAVKSTESQAWAYIKALNTDGDIVVRGTAGVAKTGKFAYRAVAVTLNYATDVADWVTV